MTDAQFAVGAILIERAEHFVWTVFLVAGLAFLGGRTMDWLRKTEDHLFGRAHPACPAGRHSTRDQPLGRRASRRCAADGADARLAG